MNGTALRRRQLAELLGSAFLAALVIGSGIAAQRLAPGAAGLELLENTAATAAGLFAIILMFGPFSGGYFNPVVSFADAVLGGLSWRGCCGLRPRQVMGCIGGAVAANLMFSGAAVGVSSRHCGSSAHFLSEAVATIGRMFSATFAGIAPASVPGFIAAQITGAIAVVIVMVLYPGAPAAEALLNGGSEGGASPKHPGGCHA